MAEFYRFRNMERLLGKDQELEKQTIYFATPEQLNDPMEGFRDIVWSGDKIVWTKLFKNCVYYLHRSYYLLRTEEDFIQLDSLPILGRWDELPPPEKDLFDDIWHKFLNLPNIQEIIEALANADHKIRYREIASYLRPIQALLLQEILKSYIAYRLISKSAVLQLPEELSDESTVVQLTQEILNWIELAEEAKDEELIDEIFFEAEKKDNDERVNQQYNSRIISSEILRKNNQLVIFDFPWVYLQQLERLLWPKWYTACFTKSYHNSSVWGHYGDSHKGACLIFEAVEIDELNNLGLKLMAGEEPKTMPFREVSYKKKAGEVDFFRSIGKLPVSVLRELWYTDQDGNTSECAPRIRSIGDVKTWLKNRRYNFYRDITIKTRDWEYEQEYRLILDNGDELDDPKNRTLTYNFNSLKGIIFGIKTSDEDRLKIIKIIERKCRESKQTDFKFFQAYYSAKDGDICKSEIESPFSDANLNHSNIPSPYN